MSMQNISLTGKVEQSFLPVARTATANGTGLATKGFRSVLAVLSVGAVTGTNPTLDVKLQDSDLVDGTYADITGAVFVQATTEPVPATDTTFVEVDLLPVNAFVRAVGTIGGTSTPTFTYSVSFVFYNAVDSAYAGTADATV